MCPDRRGPDGGDLLHGAADRVDQADLARTRRQRGVEAFGRKPAVEFGTFQVGPAGFDQGREGVLELVQCRAPFPTLLRWRLAEIAQQGSEPAVAAEDADTDGVPRAQIAGGSQSSLGFAFQFRKVVGHDSTQVVPSWTGLARPSTTSDRRKDVDGWARPAMTNEDYSAACTFLTISANAGASS